MKYLQILLILCLITSCGNRASNINEVASVELIGTTISITHEILTPREIYCMEDGFIVFDSKNKDGFLKGTSNNWILTLFYFEASSLNFTKCTVGTATLTF
ncbi:MAG: hypothetical protein R3Y50_07835 [Rikenellaceae bacterium]